MLNRRAFLQAVAATLVAPSLPAAAATKYPYTLPASISLEKKNT